MSEEIFQAERKPVLTNTVTTGEIITVLVVDDTEFELRLVAKLLDSMNAIRLVFARDGREGLAVIERESPSIVLTDLTMPEMDGLELVKQIHALHPHISVILMTAHGNEDVAMQALRAGATNYIPKKHIVRDLDANHTQSHCDCRVAAGSRKNPQSSRPA